VLAKPDRIEGIVGSAGQIAPYNVDVQGAKQTARMRAIGWKTAKDVLKKRWPKFKKEVKAVLKGAAG